MSILRRCDIYGPLSHGRQKVKWHFIIDANLGLIRKLRKKVRDELGEVENR